MFRHARWCWLASGGFRRQRLHDALAASSLRSQGAAVDVTRGIAGEAVRVGAQDVALARDGGRADAATAAGKGGLTTLGEQARKLAARFGGPIGRTRAARDDPLWQRPPRRLTWPFGLLVLSLAVPLSLLAIAAWQNYRLVERQAAERATIEAGELDAHALLAFRTYRLVLGWIDDRTRAQDWAEIEHNAELHRFLANIETLPQIDAVWIADSTGRVPAPAAGFFRCRPVPMPLPTTHSPRNAARMRALLSGARISIR